MLFDILIGLLIGGIQKLVNFSLQSKLLKQKFKMIFLTLKTADYDFSELFGKQ